MIVTPSQVAQYAYNAGFRGDALVTITAIAIAESGGVNSQGQAFADTSIVNSIGATGILQIYLAVHPDVTSAQAKDPVFSFTYAYKLSNGGKDFCPWQSYDSDVCGLSGPNGWDNRYKQFLPYARDGVARMGKGNTPSPTAPFGVKNTYPKGQCTWWANERYHTLKGVYIPWGANAKDWAGQAQQAGWSVTATPKIPSIICLQAGVQLADPTYGHVAVVEALTAGGRVHCSNQNWGGVTYPNTIFVDFLPGQGVSFISYPEKTGGSSPPPSGQTGYTGGNGNTSPPDLWQAAHDTLIHNEGMKAVALYIDELEQFSGYEDLSNGSWTDVSGIIRSWGATLTNNVPPLIIRGSLFLFGMILYISLLIKLIGGPVEEIVRGVM